MTDYTLTLKGLLFVTAWVAFALIALSAGPVIRHLKWRQRARRRKALELEMPLGRVRVGLDNERRL